MKKKYLVGLLVVVMYLSLVGCGKTENNYETNNTENNINKIEQDNETVNTENENNNINKTEQDNETDNTENKNNNINNTENKNEKEQDNDNESSNSYQSNNTEETDQRKKNYLLFGDSFFENCIKKKLGISGNISDYDMLMLDSITISSETFDISEIKYAKNLSSISLNSDVSNGLEELIQLNNIRRVDLGFRNNLDITFLSKMPQITEITYNYTNIIGGDLNMICSNKKLKKLSYRSETSGVEFIKNCNYLESLSIVSTLRQSDDISFLLSFSNLKELEFWAVGDLSIEQKNVVEQLIKKGVLYKTEAG